jgi:Domain of Unknown Function (DUF1080)
MRRLLVQLGSLSLITFAVFGCAALTGGPSAPDCANVPERKPGSGWVTLFDTHYGLSNWTQIGDANWTVVDGILQADKGAGFMVTKECFGDFQIRAEFWADSDANSGIFIRMQDGQKITAANSYEVNIYDKRPGQEYSTGAIVDVGKVALPAPKAGGQWNVYEISATGSQLTVTLNGQRTVDVQDSKHARGPFALQYAPGVVADKGVIKFRKVQIQPL